VSGTTRDLVMILARSFGVVAFGVLFAVVFLAFAFGAVFFGLAIISSFSFDALLSEFQMKLLTNNKTNSKS
jgi:hypothetical protein